MESNEDHSNDDDDEIEAQMNELLKKESDLTS